jgi:predicted N-acetyltransferase YhbS
MIRIRAMTAADIPLGLALKDQAGWNQTEADWRRFLELQPDGCFVAEWGGAAVGTAVTCDFGGVAWVAMVLVEASHRGRGIGTALVRHALDFLDGRGVRTVRLDATPLGRPLYEKLGFAADYALTRFAGEPSPAAAPPGVADAAPEDHEDLFRLDHVVTGADRREFLSRLLRGGPARVVKSGGVLAGYLLTRPGARAVQVGPCAAAAEAGPPLLADAWRRLAGRRVYADVPEGQPGAADLARAAGLAEQRRLLRMTRGPRAAEQPRLLWASSGPELG